MEGQGSFANLLDLLVQRSVGRDSLAQAFFSPERQAFELVPYARLLKTAFGLGTRMLDAGVKPNQPCLILATDRELTVTAFYAAISVGAWPMIVPTPKVFAGFESIAAHRREGTALLWEREAGFDAKLENRLRAAACLGLTEAELAAIEPSEVPARRTRPAPDEVAYLQSTSASTGNARAVLVTHRNVLDNTSAIRMASQCGAK